MTDTELSTRQISETIEATGLMENKTAGHEGGQISKEARLKLEQKTGKKIVSNENYLSDVSTAFSNAKDAIKYLRKSTKSKSR